MPQDAAPPINPQLKEHFLIMGRNRWNYIVIFMGIVALCACRPQDAALENSGERLELLSQAEDVLLSDGVVLPISHPVTLNIIDQQAVGGWYPNALDIHPLKYLAPKQAPLFIPNLVMAE